MYRLKDDNSHSPISVYYLFQEDEAIKYTCKLIIRFLTLIAIYVRMTAPYCLALNSTVKEV
jgi:hypothetical protein